MDQKTIPPLNSARIEFELAQGWSKNLVLAFEDASSSAALDLAGGEFLHVKQVHGKKIHEVTSRELSLPPRDVLGEADGLCARLPDFKKSRKKLLIKTADCIPLVYVDVLNESVAILHAGWRGLAQGIHRLPFAQRHFDPKSTWLWLGPSLSGKNFPVKVDMWSQFPQALADSAIFAPHTEPDTKLFHAWLFVEKELDALGVELLYNVEVDTFADKTFASYRRARSEGLAKSPQFNASWIGFR